MSYRRLLAVVTLVLSGSATISGIAQKLQLPAVFADHAVLQRDKPIVIHGYAEPGKTISATLDNKTVTASSDPTSGRWEVTFPAHGLGAPLTLVVTSGKDHLQVGDLLMGDVWLASGQSNMHFAMKPSPPSTEGVLNSEAEIPASANPKIRFFTVPSEAAFPAKSEADGTWQISSPDTACMFSGVAYYFAQEVVRQTGVPIGILYAAVGGTPIDAWMEPSRINPAELASDQVVRDAHPTQMASYQAHLPAFYAAAHQATFGCNATTHSAYINPPVADFVNQSSGCYNAMILPFKGVAVKGFLWYQGESDAKHYELYTDKMKALIENWRTLFNDSAAPFYYVQLANRDFRPPNLGNPNFINGRTGELRYAQFEVLSVPHTGMAVAGDVGDPQTIHPRDKKSVGLRLAYQALRKTYGMTNVVADGPIYSSFDTNGKELTLHFLTNGSPLINRTGSNEPDGFEIAGADNKFVPAISEIRGETVILTSPVIKAPLHARYASSDNPTLSLYNSARLPAPTFQTK